MNPTEDMVRVAGDALLRRGLNAPELEIYKAAIEALTAALAAMWQDHVIVPREATEEMIDAACVAQIALYPAWEGQKPSPTAGEVIATVYRAMVSAAPTLLSTRMGSEKMAEG